MLSNASRRRPSAASTGAIFMKFGRVPTTDRTLRGAVIGGGMINGGPMLAPIPESAPADRSRWANIGPSILLLLALGLALRVVWALSHKVVPVSDFQTYNSLAANFAEHGEYAVTHGVPTAFRPPGWPLLLGAVYEFTGPRWTAGALLNAFLSWGAVVAGAGIALRLLQRRFAVLAIAAMALYPAAIAYVPVLGTEDLAALLLTVCVALLVLEPLRGWSAFLFGLAAGGLVLTRPDYGLTIVVVGAIVLATRRARLPLLRYATLAVLGVALVVVPWTVRNANRFGEFIPTGTNGGVTFY